VELSSDAKDMGLTTGDYTLTYGDNRLIGDESGTVTINGKGNATGNIILTFDIYTGLTVFVTKDGSGNLYDDGTAKLSNFGTSTIPLYDMSLITPGKSQTVSMYAVNNNDPHTGISGLKLGIVVKELSGDGTFTGENDLHKYLVLTVKHAGKTYTTTINGAYENMLILGDLGDPGEIPLEVTLNLPSDTPGYNVQGKSIEFKLAVGVIYPGDEPSP
jgi:hypothetical protein